MNTSYQPCATAVKMANSILINDEASLGILCVVLVAVVAELEKVQKRAPQIDQRAGTAFLSSEIRLKRLRHFRLEKR